MASAESRTSPVFRWHLLDRAIRLFASREGTAASPNEGPSARPAPPFTAEAVLASHATLVRRIRSAYGYPDEEYLDHLFTPITALAGWLHLLPGCPGGGFERCGGAVEQALTNCLFSLQAADGRTFASTGAEAPLHDTQRWQLACALGGLFLPLREVLGRIEVISDDGHVWPGVGMPLLEWLASLTAPRYRYRWASPGSPSGWPAMYAACRCLGPHTMSFLVRGDARIAANLIGCICGADLPTNQVAEVVARIAAAVAAHQRPGRPASSAELLADTLKRLLSTSEWLPNAPGGHVWYGKDGLYLLWPEAATKLLEAMPRGDRGADAFVSHDQLLQHLVDHRIVEASPSPLLHIHIPGDVKPRVAVRVTDPQHWIDGLRRDTTVLDLHPRIQRLDEVGDGSVAASRTSTAGDCEGPSSGTAAKAWDGDDTPCQRSLPFTEPTPALDADRSPATGAALMLDTSRITNPRTRKVVDEVVARLDQSFDGMLARTVEGGVFVALTEFVGENGDAAAVVRALHEAQLLAANDAAPDRRVVYQSMGGADVKGVVLRGSALVGYSDWAMRWRENT